MQILEGEKVSKYFGGLAAVCAVDFNISQGEVVGLIGPNGSGISFMGRSKLYGMFL